GIVVERRQLFPQPQLRAQGGGIAAVPGALNPTAPDAPNECLRRERSRKAQLGGPAEIIGVLGPPGHAIGRAVVTLVQPQALADMLTLELSTARRVIHQRVLLESCLLSLGPELIPGDGDGRDGR